MMVFLTPDLKPFFGGTYFPPASRWGRPGFSTCSGSSHVCGRRSPAGRASATDLLDRLMMFTRTDAHGRGDSTMPGRRPRAAVESYRNTCDQWRWLRRRTQVSATRSSGACVEGVCTTTHRRSGPGYATDGDRHNGRWPWAECTTTSAAVSALLRRRRMAGSAFREDALRQRATRAAYLEASQVTGETTTPRRGGHADLRPARHDRRTAASTRPRMRTAKAHERRKFVLLDKSEGEFYIWSRSETGELTGEMPQSCAPFGITGQGNFADHSDPSSGAGTTCNRPQRSWTPIFRTGGHPKTRLADSAVRKKMFDVRGAIGPPASRRQGSRSWNGLMLGAFARAPA